jgi:hypothetical protein
MALNVDGAFYSKRSEGAPTTAPLFKSVFIGPFAGMVGSPPMSSIQGALIFRGLMLAVALTIAWASFLSYEVLKLAEFVF